MHQRAHTLPVANGVLRRRTAGAATLLLASAIAWLFPAPAKAGPPTLYRVALAETRWPEVANTTDTTDRMIVKYRARTPGNRRSVLSASRDTHGSLHQAGVYAVSAHFNAQGAQVLRLDRHLPVDEMQQLAQRVMANDPTVLYAEPDRILKAQAAPLRPDVRPAVGLF